MVAVHWAKLMVNVTCLDRTLEGLRKYALYSHFRRRFEALNHRYQLFRIPT
jgi:hypothetical protein